MSTSIPTPFSASRIPRPPGNFDVVELIKHAQLGRDLADELDESVRSRYLEYWDTLQAPDPTPM